MVLVIYFNMALDTKILVSYVLIFGKKCACLGCQTWPHHDHIMTTRSKYATMMVNCNGDKCKLKPWNQSLIGIHLLGLHGSAMFEYKQTWPHVFLQFLGTFILNWQINFYHIHAQHMHSTWHSKRPRWMSASFFVDAKISSMLLHFAFVNKVTANKEI